MSISHGQSGWPALQVNQSNGSRLQQVVDDSHDRTDTPTDAAAAAAREVVPEAPTSDIEEDARRAQFTELYRTTEARIALLFAEDGSYNQSGIESLRRPVPPPPSFIPPATDHTPAREPPRKKVKRVIDEDDYGDDDDEEDENEEEEAEQPGQADDAGHDESPLKRKSVHAAAAKSLLSPSKSGSSPVHSVPSPGRQQQQQQQQQQDKANDDGQEKSSEDARKELEEARNATEEAAKRSFHTLFYTLENDRTAMLEQKQLEESEKQLQAEMDKTGGANPSQTGPGQQHGSLSNANLGASSLTLKHLIARIDLKRSQVKASDAELRSLMNEVRKNRSKWASEENVGQEELYEALEKVLSELKAHTEYSTPFLNRVNKRDAPDYYNFIKQPMDLGSMTKKLKGLTYKSKAEFVTDLNLIWDNCLRYNQDMGHPLRRMANGMRKEAEKLIPLIPDVTIRPRAEVEAEERRKQNGGDDDAGDDSDDEPIMSSRGRIAGAKGTNKSRKAPTDQNGKEGTPNIIEQKPVLQLNGLLGKPHGEGSEVEGSNGFGTPPVGGSSTPSGVNGHSGVSNADAMDIDGPSLNDMALDEALGEAAEQVHEDEEYKIWKQVTKKDRAQIAKERFQLFKNNKLNVDEPALLRTKGGMRRYMKARKQAEATGATQSQQADSTATGTKDGGKAGESLAEGMEDQHERTIPDYYEPQTVIPDIPSKLQWVEDGEGQVINQHEEFLRLVPPGQFVAPVSKLTKRFDENIRQMQETRRLCSKIGVIKQMQIQAQVYSNQFQKYNPEPFVEMDIEPTFISGEGPVMAAETCKAAMQRSVAKIFYHAGFEELQPSALEVVTDIAGDYFQKLVRSFNVFREAEKKPATGVYAERGAKFQPRFTNEEVILHTLSQLGHEVDILEGYARDDVPKLGSRLNIIHDRMKAHLADLLRPALHGDAGPDGAGAFNDGSEQFVGGDFAEELGEDFFGFKSLGLDQELGLEVLSVPLHLLQSRVRSQFQTSQAQVPGGNIAADLFDALPPLEPVTTESIQNEVGLVKNFFLAKLHANNDQPLVEDEDLPVKQRRPRPRLGATGKIVSPQKRPPKEQIALAKKKKKLESQGQAGGLALPPAAGGGGGGGGVQGSPEKGTPSKKRTLTMPNAAGSSANLTLAPPMERMESVQSGGGGTDKDEAAVGMMSPESIER